jgi:hypothetical protein
MDRDIIITINDPEQNIVDLKAKVIGYDDVTHMVFYKIITHEYEGLTLYSTHIRNCKPIIQ